MKTKISVLVLVSLFAAPHVFAQEWRIEPVLRFGYEIDDNATLNIITVDEPDISGYIGELSVLFGYLSPTSSFSITPSVVARRYGDEEFDADEQFLDMRFNRSWESSRFRFRFNYANEPVRTGERLDTNFDIEEPDEIPEDTTGLVAVRDDRQRLTFVPRYSFDISSATSMGFDFRYTDVSYDQQLAGLLNDYRDWRFNTGWRRSMSQRTDALFTLTYRDYQAAGNESVRGYGFNGGIDRLLSEKTRLRIIVGVENTETIDGESEIDPVGEITLTRQLETIRLLAQYRHIISGGGSGNLTARDVININFVRNLSERISAGLGVRAYATRSRQAVAGTLEERDYVQLRAQIVWNITRTFQFEANYRYTVLDRATVGESANSNNVQVWFNWRPDGFSSAT